MTITYCDNCGRDYIENQLIESTFVIKHESITRNGIDLKGKERTYQLCVKCATKIMERINHKEGKEDDEQ